MKEKKTKNKNDDTKICKSKYIDCILVFMHNNCIFQQRIWKGSKKNLGLELELAELRRLLLGGLVKDNTFFCYEIRLGPGTPLAQGLNFFRIEAQHQGTYF